MPLTQGGPPEWIWGRTSEALKWEVGAAGRADGLRVAGAVRPGDRAAAILHRHRADFTRAVRSVTSLRRWKAR